MSTTNGTTKTLGVRTWQRTSSNPALPLDARIHETTDPARLEQAIRAADFITIPREVVEPTGEVVRAGYDDAYAAALAEVLRARYGYAGLIRTSTSGRSHVFEREALSQGAPFDFGLSVDAFAPSAISALHGNHSSAMSRDSAPSRPAVAATNGHEQGDGSHGDGTHRFTASAAPA